MLKNSAFREGVGWVSRVAHLKNGEMAFTSTCHQPHPTLKFLFTDPISIQKLHCPTVKVTQIIFIPYFAFRVNGCGAAG
jgi:hypothetical protein